MKKAIRNSFAALVLGATALGGVAATPAMAKKHHDNGRHEGQRKHDDHRGSSRGDYYRDHYNAPDRRVVVIHRYDYNRPDPRYHGYYANRYYRGGYRPIVVTRETRVYRGDDGRYYCRRSDGTTGLIVGAVLGGVVGDRIDRGHSSILGAVLGATAGGLLGREIDRGSVTCR